MNILHVSMNSTAKYLPCYQILKNYNIANIVIVHSCIIIYTRDYIKDTDYKTPNTLTQGSSWRWVANQIHINASNLNLE